MAEDTPQDQAQTQQAFTGDLPDVKISPPQIVPDFATVFGIIGAIGLIAGAIMMGGSNANFLNGPSIMIVVLGTMAATAVSYTPSELGDLPGIMARSLIRRFRRPAPLVEQLMNLATIARKQGVLALAKLEPELSKDSFLARAVELVTDGYAAEDIERVMWQEMDALSERHRRSAGILRRAAEVAPAMGLIGTLVGLVQMLADLDNPSAIGPAMAVALLTTFYGAIMGTVVLAPLAGKLERNSNDEAASKILILTTMSSIARQENPRQLEMALNSKLPPKKRITYFD